VRGVINAAGGFAEFMIVPAGQAVEVPSGLATVAAAALVDAGTTAVNAADVVAALGAPGRVLVAGGGPVGFLLAEVLRSRQVDALVVEPQPGRRDALTTLGYATVASLEDVESPVAIVADCAGVAAVVPAALALLAPLGALIVVGYTQLGSFDMAPIARKELTVRGVRSGTKDQLEVVLQLAANAAIRLPPIRTWPITEINGALQALRAAEVPGKAVVVNPEVVKEGSWTS
jgi:D-arabinose 1-dehydrogenase-like Zn-dependent alcohol dehydrogenase